MESKQGLNSHRKGCLTGPSNGADEPLEAGPLFCHFRSSASVSFLLSWWTSLLHVVGKHGDHRCWLFQIMVVPTRERPPLGFWLTQLGSSSSPTNWLWLEAKEELGSSCWNVMYRAGKGTMTRRESSGGNRIIDPLYNGLICHAQCWSSYPDIAAKIVSWTLVRLRLWHVDPRCSLCSNSHSLSSFRHVSSMKLSQSLHSRVVSFLLCTSFNLYLCVYTFNILMCLCICECCKYLRVEVMGTLQLACTQHLVNT